MIENKTFLVLCDLVHQIFSQKETGLLIWNILKRNSELLIWDRGSIWKKIAFRLQEHIEHVGNMSECVAYFSKKNSIDIWKVSSHWFIGIKFKIY